MSVEKIKSGLEQRETLRLGRPSKFAVLKTAPKNTTELKMRSDVVFKSRDALCVMQTETNLKIKTERERKAAELYELGRVREPNGAVVDTWDDAARRKLCDQHMASYSRELRATQDKAAQELIGKVKLHSEGIKAVESMWSSALTMLHLETISNPKRAEYAATMRDATVTAVGDTLLAAMVNENFAMAAAALDAYDKIDKNLKSLIPYLPTEVAREMMGEQWTESRELLGLVDIAAVDAEAQFHAVNGKDITSEHKMGMALRVDELEKEIGRKVQKEDDAARVEEEVDEDKMELGPLLAKLIDEDREAEAPAILKKRLGDEYISPDDNGEEE